MRGDFDYRAIAAEAFNLGREWRRKNWPDNPYGLKSMKDIGKKRYDRVAHIRFFDGYFYQSQHEQDDHCREWRRSQAGHAVLSREIMARFPNIMKRLGE
jgi:hypothetical protein